MPQSPYNEPPLNLGIILNQIYGIDNKPYDSVEILWTKVARSLGIELSDYLGLEAILSRIADEGASPGGGSGFVSAEPSTDEFLKEVSLISFDNDPGLVGITDVTISYSSSRGTVDFENCDDLVSVNFPNLVSVGDGTANTYLWVSGGASFTTFSAPLLASISVSTGYAMGFQDNPLMTTLSLPSLVTLNGDLFVLFNVALANVSFPLWVPTPGRNIAVHGCALTASSVNHLLARAVASPTWGNAGETIDLEGGTNAAPTGQGILDVATLTGRGATVLVN